MACSVCSFAMWFFLSYFNLLSSRFFVCLLVSHLSILVCCDIFQTHINFPILIHKKRQCGEAMQRRLQPHNWPNSSSPSDTLTKRTHAHLQLAKSSFFFLVYAEIVCWFRMNEIQITCTSIGWMCVFPSPRFLFHVYFGSSFGFFFFFSILSSSLPQSNMFARSEFNKPLSNAAIDIPFFSRIDLWIIIGLSESLRKQRIYIWVKSLCHNHKITFSRGREKERERERKCQFLFMMLPFQLWQYRNEQMFNSVWQVGNGYIG